MATHRATCQDCHETYIDSDLLKVSEWAEDHERTEVHDVRIERAVATDGGHIPGHQPGTAPPVERGRDWICPGCDQAYHGRPDIVDDAGARWRCYCSIGCYIEDLQFLGAELHKCDLCDQVFYDVDKLAAHDCDPSVEKLFPDGGSEMYWDGEPCPRADCEGQLQHQDQINVMCLACKEEWSAAILRGEHVLVDSDGERVNSESQGGCHE